MRKMFIILCLMVSLVALPVSAVEMTSAQKTAISDNCDAIKDNLKLVQREDSRVRVYLGRYYETILAKFITPLNVRLVENSMSETKLIDNQEEFVKKRMVFINDYIAYQQNLEELVNVDCKTEPEKFYKELVETREKREIMNQDAAKMRELTERQVTLVTKLMEGLK